MSNSGNHFHLVGRLGRDPELKAVGQTSLCELSIATDRSVKKGDQWEKVTDWHKVKVWGREAEYVAKYAAKGREVYVSGSIRPWKAEKNGETRYGIDLIADGVRLLGPKSERPADVMAPVNYGGHSYKPTETYSEPDEHDDIPF